MDKDMFKKALKDTIPVLGGYLFLGMGFGILLYHNGYGPIYAFLMSLFIYAGSLQYAGTKMLTGVSLGQVTLTSFLINVRHLFYGLSMIERYQDVGKKKPYLIFSLTDETYSLLSSKDEGIEYDFYVSLLDQCYWITGSLLGSFLATALSLNVKGLDFVLTALFLTIFVDNVLKGEEREASFSGLLISAVCLFLFGKDLFLIPAMILITIFLLWRRRRENG